MLRAKAAAARVDGDPVAHKQGEILMAHVRFARRASRCRMVMTAAVAVSSVLALQGGVPVGAASPSTNAPADDPLAPAPLAERTSVVFAMSGPIETYLNVLLAVELGEFEAENLDVKIEFVGAADQPLLLHRGDVDAIGNTLTAGILNLIAEGSPIRAVALQTASNPDAMEGFWIRRDALGDDGEFQVEDLLGQPISTVFGAASAGAISYLLYEAEQRAPGVLNANNLTHTALPLVDGVTALENGGVPVAMAVAPFSQVLDASGCCEFIGFWPSFPAGVTYFGQRLLVDEPEVGEAVIRAMARTARDHLSGDYHRDSEIAETIADVMQQPLDRFDTSFSPSWSQMALNPLYLEILQPYLFEYDDGSLVSFDEPLELDAVFDQRYSELLNIG